MKDVESQKPQPKITRRSFLGISFFGVLGLFVVQSIAAAVKFLKPISTGGFGGMIYAGRVEEFPIGSVNHILAGRCYVVRIEDGFLALWQRCTHLGCSVPWAEDIDEFHCPCHGSLFDKVGLVTGGPAPRPLDIFPVIIRSGEVWVDTGKPIQRTQFEPDQVTGA
jgi:cytochrome b6-f complex iron-sulfur subunit